MVKLSNNNECETQKYMSILNKNIKYKTSSTVALTIERNYIVVLELNPQLSPGAYFNRRTFVSNDLGDYLLNAIIFKGT